MIPYQIVVGERDAAAKTVAVRTRAGEQGAVPVGEFIERCLQEIGTRGVSQAVANSGT